MAYRAPRTPEERQEYLASVESNMACYGRAEKRRLSAIGATEGFVEVRPEVRPSAPGEDSLVVRDPWVAGLAVVAAIFGGGMLLFGLGKSATAAAAATGATASAAGAVKSVAAWTPQGATGLGAMFL